jgi:hypothetical protein
VSDDGTFKGQGEIRNWVKSGLDQGRRLEIEPSVEKSSGTLAYRTGRTRRLVGSVVHLAQYLIVMEKIGEEWKIVQHFSLSGGEIEAANLMSCGYRKRQRTAPNETSSDHDRSCRAAISLYPNFWYFAEQKSPAQRPKSFWEASYGCATRAA